MKDCNKGGAVQGGQLMKERIMGKGSIKGRLGKDDQAAETKDPTDKSCLAHTYRKTQIYTPATHA